MARTASMSRSSPRRSSPRRSNRWLGIPSGAGPWERQDGARSKSSSTPRRTPRHWTHCFARKQNSIHQGSQPHEVAPTSVSHRRVVAVDDGALCSRSAGPPRHSSPTARGRCITTTSATPGRARTWARCSRVRPGTGDAGGHGRQDLARLRQAPDLAIAQRRRLDRLLRHGLRLLFRRHRDDDDEPVPSPHADVSDSSPAVAANGTVYIGDRDNT